MINIAIIGMGQRGKATLKRLHDIPQSNVCICCDADIDWHEVVCNPAVQLVWVCTPWEWHLPMAVEAMQAGKDVALEVPAVMTLQECQKLLEISHSMQRHCIILENCCYDTWHLGIREMIRRGMLGRIKHLEGAYAHMVGEGWMRDHGRRHSGNPYPTHAFGPMCQLLDKDDAPEYLVSMSSRIPGDHVNTSLIHSIKGVSMMLHYDVSTPRPYNRLQTVCGTLGFAQKYPQPTIVIDGDKTTGGQTVSVNLTGDEAVRFVEGFIPQNYREIIAEGKRLGVKNVMNYMMDRRIVETMQKVLDARSSGQPEPSFDMDVHEAALWSSVIEMTKLSVEQGSVPITFNL